MCLFLLLCTVGSFSEHLDQINGRSECVDSTDNSSKPSSESASHMARQRLESTEKKKISGKVTKSLSASALSLMIPGGRAISTRMKLCDLCMCSPFLLPQSGMLTEMQDCMRQSRVGSQDSSQELLPTHLCISPPGPLGQPESVCLSISAHILCLGRRLEMFLSHGRRVSFVFLKPFSPHELNNEFDSLG